jgi:hypothetical protein
MIMRTLSHLISPTPGNHRAHQVMARTICHLRDDCASALAIVRGVLGTLSFSIAWFGFTPALRLATVPVSVMDTPHPRSHRWPSQAQPRKEHNL